MSSTQNKNGLTRLLEIVEKLRGHNGCPWDRKQTPGSIKKYLLEESEELAEAIETGDSAHICEEIGDLFYILSMLITMYKEQGLFSIEDVLEGISGKMIRRHPHVFAGLKTGTDTELRQQWEAIKAREKTELVIKR